jgi:integrase
VKEIDRAREAGEAIKPGREADGDGLNLQVPEVSWISLFRFQGKRHEMGLGSARKVSLKGARASNAEIRRKVAEGINPLAERATRRARTATSKNFLEAARAFLPVVKAELKNDKSFAQWLMTLTGETEKRDDEGRPVRAKHNYCAAIHNVPVADITTDLVLAVLNPVWSKKYETASRLRGRIERVLAWAVRQGMAGNVDPDKYLNPARWDGHLEYALSAKSKVHEVTHHAALPYTEAPAFYGHLTQGRGLAACAFRFAMLTATRTGDLFGSSREECPPMNWSHVDLDARLWTIPKTKNGAEHRVPLSDAAVELLKQLRKAYPVDASGIVFAAEKPGTALSNGAMLRVRDRLIEAHLIEPGTVTPHGMSRACFKSWASEETSFEKDVIEACLSHTISDEVEAAYRRSDFIKKRTKLMQAWADYLTGKTGDKVVTLTTKSA